MHVHEGRVVSNGGDNSLSATPPPPAPHSVHNGPDYVNDPNSLQAFHWYVSVFPAFFSPFFFFLIISTRLLFIAGPTSFFSSSSFLSFFFFFLNFLSVLHPVWAIIMIML